MKQICDKDLCTGCSACMNICPHSAISMVEYSGAGYIYPFIQSDKCVDCHLCVDVCPVVHPLIFSEPKAAIAVIAKDFRDLTTSTSGGASAVLAKYILLQGGVVYGCVQRNYMDISHRRIHRMEDLNSLKGSKYVQSHIGLCYKQVKQDLKQGIPVLFTGTPCQIAGLRNYLRKEYSNLYLVDLVCHGVPSQKMLREDINHLFRKFGTPPTNLLVSFRRKRKNNLRYGTFIEHPQISELSPKEQKFPNDNYITAFMSGIIFRKNCFSCPYARPYRISDITLADFWGYQGKQLDVSQGVSLMLPSTDKGVRLTNSIKQYIHWEERPVSEAVQGNGQLMAPSIEPVEREVFHSMYVTNPQEAYFVCLKAYRKEWRKKLLLQTAFFQWKPIRYSIILIARIRKLLK